jgi:tetratricopeptide (TPR) repeat protein
MKTKKSKVTLSLSMIVKNEEKFLEGCLQSVQGVVDEIVIVDTGSTDRTKEIAQRFGAQLFDFAWTGDFSAARNFSLSHCSSDWILYLDADERIAPGKDAQIRRLLTDDTVGAYNLMIESEHTFDHGTVKQSNAYPRLFRNLPGIRFEGRVHEQILPSLQRCNLTIVQTSITIIHLGYAQGTETLKQKAQRNIELLKQQLAQNPDDAYARFQLGNTYVIQKNYKAAKEELDIALASPLLPGSSRATAYNLLAEVEVKGGDLSAAAEYCRKSLALAPTQLMAHWFLALILCDMRKYGEAIPQLEELEHLFELPASRRTTHIASDLDLKKGEALLRLAFCYEQTNRFRDGMEKYAQASEVLQDSSEALNGFLRCQARVDDSRLAIQKLLSLAQRHPERKEFFFPLALHHRRMNDVPAALKFIEQTLKADAENASAYACAIRWRMETGDHAGARLLLAEAEAKQLKLFELHKCGLELALRSGDVDSAFSHLELMTQTTDADLSHLKSRISALAAKLGRVPVT